MVREDERDQGPVGELRETLLRCGGLNSNKIACVKVAT